VRNIESKDETSSKILILIDSKTDNAVVVTRHCVYGAWGARWGESWETKLSIDLFTQI